MATDVCPFCGVTVPPYSSEEYPYCHHQVAIWANEPDAAGGELSGECACWFGNDCVRHASRLHAAALQLMNAIVWHRGGEAGRAEPSDVARGRASVHDAVRHGGSTPAWLSAWDEWLDEYYDSGCCVDPDKAAAYRAPYLGRMVAAILGDLPHVAVGQGAVVGEASRSLTYVWAAVPESDAHDIEDSIVAAGRLLDGLAAKVGVM